MKLEFIIFHDSELSNMFLHTFTDGLSHQKFAKSLNDVGLEIKLRALPGKGVCHSMSGMITSLSLF